LHAEEFGIEFVAISGQFELVVQKWMNNVDNPTNAPHPIRNVTTIHNEGKDSSGFDILVGQNQDHKDNRNRFGYIQTNINNETVEGRITSQGLNILDWVIPTGGGYFFSPSITAFRSILGSQE
jgi:hypothetical protein